MTVRLIKIIKNKVFKSKKGNLVKYVSSKDKFFRKFGEIYFNEIKLKKKKGWILHKKNHCLIVCVTGKVKFFFIDRLKKEKYITLTSNSGNILKIPPRIWFAFQGLSKNSIIANLIETPHQDNEVIKNQTVKNYFIK
tara:strand:- start:1490 stop:1900 length:411 start_codon:yes stop_codon:yes gene_type:complete